MTELLQRDQDTQTATLVLIRATELGKLNAQRGFQSGMPTSRISPISSPGW